MGWILIALAVLPASAPAQRFAFKYYAHDQGLISLDVHSLLQDRTGYVWVATADGLFRYDGERFTGFYTVQGLPSNRVESLHQASDGTIWVGTRDGLARFEGDRFRAVSLPEPVAFLSQSSLASDLHGSLYMGTSRGLWVMGKAQRGAVRLYPQNSAGTRPEVYGVHVDPEGAVWFGCGMDLCRYDHDKVVVLGTESGVPQDIWNAILTDHSGNLWVRSSTRLLTKGRTSKRFTAVK
ncbi:MAG TPA: two-component regulator propeller domain-containing protein, partial [Terriglobales bacterium]|nr:two-component regulator propeller domain-containing protein [Terriglobales bacterium]